MMNMQSNKQVLSSNLHVDSFEKKIDHFDGKGSVELLEVFGSDLTVVNAARVSFNKTALYETEFFEDEAGIQQERLVLAKRDVGLINFLAEHKHITPFFHPQLQFRIKMPIFVAREWFRSVIGFARNEVSRRYIQTTPECFVPRELRRVDGSIKQGSSDKLVEQNDVVVAKMRAFSDQAVALYEELLASGVCPEQARIILPQGMYTEFIETASLSAYARIVALRKEATAQREIQWYALAIDQLAQQKFPVSWAALMKYS
jgi:thymidylate synthase (FAD)